MIEILFLRAMQIGFEYVTVLGPYANNIAESLY